MQTIEEYLFDLGRRLPHPSARSTRFLVEVQDHLREVVRENERAGIAAAESEQQAI